MIYIYILYWLWYVSKKYDMIWLGSNVAAKIHCVEGDGTHRCALAKAVRRCWKRAVEKTPNGLQFRSANSMIFLHVQSFSIIFHGVFGEKSRSLKVPWKWHVPLFFRHRVSLVVFGSSRNQYEASYKKQPKVSDGEAWFPKNIWA